MIRLIAVFALGLAMVAGAGGCKHDHDDDDMHHDKMSSSSKADACPECPGVQTATADGRCPVCHKKVKM
jgi:hypothetical protein